MDRMVTFVVGDDDGRPVVLMGFQAIAFLQAPAAPADGRP